MTSRKDSILYQIILGYGLAHIAFHVSILFVNLYHSYDIDLYAYLTFQLTYLILIPLPLLMYFNGYYGLILIPFLTLIFLQYRYCPSRIAYLMIALDLFIWLWLGYWVGMGA